jgi:acyl-CoA thioester hydrolase
MRYDPRLLELTSYPHVRVLDLMFSDMDIQRHVNNVAITRLFEEARSSLHRLAMQDEAGTFTSIVLARLEVHYLREVSYPGQVEIAIGMGPSGRSSFDNVAALFQDGECAALMWATHARRNEDRGAGQDLSETERKVVERYRVPGS